MVFAILSTTLFAGTVFAQTLKTGIIKGQSVKWTTGSVSIIRQSGRNVLKLGSDFKTKKGPALFVYLGNARPEKKVGKLKSVSGAQSYDIPAKLDIKRYSRVFIYCIPFDAVFGVGTIK